jgi:hypothetical protein
MTGPCMVCQTVGPLCQKLCPEHWGAMEEGRLFVTNNKTGERFQVVPSGTHEKDCPCFDNEAKAQIVN